MIQRSPPPVIRRTVNRFLFGCRKRLFSNVSSTVDPLARLRIIKHGVLAVDFMLDFEVACIRSIPMALQASNLLRSSIGIAPCELRPSLPGAMG